MALNKFAKQANCSRRVRTNSARNKLNFDEVAKLIRTTLDSAEERAANTLDEDAYEDFTIDLINLLNDHITRLRRFRQERLMHWDNE